MEGAWFHLEYQQCLSEAAEQDWGSLVAGVAQFEIALQMGVSEDSEPYHWARQDGATQLFLTEDGYGVIWPYLQAETQGQRILAG